LDVYRERARGKETGASSSFFSRSASECRKIQSSKLKIQKRASEYEEARKGASLGFQRLNRPIAAYLCTQIKRIIEKSDEMNSNQYL